MFAPVPSRKGGRQRQNLFVGTSGPDQPAAHDHLVHIDRAGHITKEGVIPSSAPRPEDLQAEYADFAFGLDAMDDSHLADVDFSDDLVVPPAPSNHHGDDIEEEEEYDGNDETEGKTRKRKFYKSSVSFQHLCIFVCLEI